MMSDVPFAQYMDDRKLQLAVERSLEIIGEAARRVSPVFRESHPEVPWRRIIGLRNVLAHETAKSSRNVCGKSHPPAFLT